MPDNTRYIFNREDLGLHSASPNSDDFVETYGPPYLAEIIQPSHDTITIRPDSIIHTDATGHPTRKITFQRNSDGLITAVSDPNAQASGGPPAVKYEYDGYDNLMYVEKLVDRTAGTYVTDSFAYTNANFPHYITSIENGDGVPVARKYYDDSGKLIAVQDATGNLTQFIHNRQQHGGCH